MPKKYAISLIFACFCLFLRKKLGWDVFILINLLRRNLRWNVRDLVDFFIKLRKKSVFLVVYF